MSAVQIEERTNLPKYAALSHCWGTTHEPQLNERTAKDFTEGIPIQDLPNLYRDAVILARSVSTPYLWIDSLCIKQDSMDDWRRESSKMGAIYRNSYLCIAATASKDIWQELYHAPQFLKEPSTWYLHSDQSRPFLERWSELISFHSDRNLIPPR